ALDVLVLVAAAADPVVLATARVVALEHVSGVAMTAQPGDLVALGGPMRGDVDVEQHALGQPVLEGGARDGGREPRGVLELEGAAGGEAEGDGRNAEDDALHRGGDGARVDDVI